MALITHKDDVANAFSDNLETEQVNSQQVVAPTVVLQQQILTQ